MARARRGSTGRTVSQPIRLTNDAGNGTYNLDDLVVLGVFVGLQVVCEPLSVSSDVTALSSLEIVDHTVVEGEHRSRRTNFGTHVADRGHTRARERFDTRTRVLDDSTSTALDRKNTSDLEDDVLGSSPAADLAREINTDDLGALKLPRNASHNVDGVGTTDTARDHTETTSVGSMRVGTDHKTTGESVVFEDNLMNDSGTGFPETEAILRGKKDQYKRVEDRGK